MIFSILGEIKEPTALNSAVDSDIINRFSRFTAAWVNFIDILKLPFVTLLKLI